MTAENIAFGITAAVMAIAAIRVVTTTNVVRAALYLVLVLGGVGVNFILLGAEFTAVTQLIVYIGAVVVLFLFGIFLTRAPIGRTADLDNDQRWMAVLVSLLLLGVLVGVLQDAFKDTKVGLEQPQPAAQVGDAIFSTYLIPFEVVSVLLLAALIGAIVLARRD